MICPLRSSRFTPRRAFAPKPKTSWLGGISPSQMAQLCWIPPPRRPACDPFRALMGSHSRLSRARPAGQPRLLAGQQELTLSGPSGAAPPWRIRNRRLVVRLLPLGAASAMLGPARFILQSFEHPSSQHVPVSLPRAAATSFQLDDASHGDADRIGEVLYRKATALVAHGQLLVNPFHKRQSRLFHTRICGYSLDKAISSRKNHL